MFLNENSEKLNLTFYRRNRPHSGQKVFFCNFFNIVHTQLKVDDNFNMSLTHCEKFRQITPIDYLWCRYE